MYMYIRQILWPLFRNIIPQLAVYFPTVYKAVTRRDRPMTETTIFCFATAPRNLGQLRNYNSISTLVLVNHKTVTSLNPSKMADSLPLGTDVNAVPSPIARLKTGPKGGQKSSLSDDVKLKLAQHISSQLDIRHILLIPGKRNKKPFFIANL